MINVKWGGLPVVGNSTDRLAVAHLQFEIDNESSCSASTLQTEPVCSFHLPLNMPIYSISIVQQCKMLEASLDLTTARCCRSMPLNSRQCSYDCSRQQRTTTKETLN